MHPPIFPLHRFGGMDSVHHVPPPPALSDLPRAELEALLVELFTEVASLKQIVADQRDEIARLKGLKGRPTIKPSGMDKGTEAEEPGLREKRRLRGKVAPRVKIEEEVIAAEVPPGSGFKGYEPFPVQDLVISVRATRYQRERWITPDGRTILSPLPEGIEGHFGPELRRFVLMQYHQGQTTLPRLLSFLRSVGVSISKRQVQRLLTDKQDAFINEAQAVLRAGLETSPYVSVDDIPRLQENLPCPSLQPGKGLNRYRHERDTILTPEERTHFLRKMRQHLPSPVHRRMNALLLLDDGWAAERVAEALFIDAETLREHRRLYRTEGATGHREAALRRQRAGPGGGATHGVGSRTGRSALYDGEGDLRLCGPDVPGRLHPARDGQAAETAGVRLQEAEMRAGQGPRGRTTDVRGRGPRPIDGAGQR